MPNHVQSELTSRYLARAGFFWRRVKDSRFKDWQKAARNAAWENLEWNWKELGITDTAREAAKTPGLVPIEGFVHPAVILKKPELLEYYRLPACLPNKGLVKINS